MATHSIQLPGFGKHAPGFEEPFEMLHACHERVQRMLALLGRLRMHADSHGADEQARQAARDVMRYFDVAAPQHHLDEERHVIPRLAACGDAALVALATKLQADHAAMEQAWAKARALLLDFAEGTLPRFDADAHRTLGDFAALYASHLLSEEAIAFPTAQRGMDAAALQAMSQDMMRRRGVT